MARRGWAQKRSMHVSMWAFWADLQHSHGHLDAFLRWVIKKRWSTPSYTIKIFFPSNFFFQSRRLKNIWCHMTGADLFPSGDLLPGVSKANYFLIAIFCAAGGLLFLCLGGASLINYLHSLVLCCMKIWMIGELGYESLLRLRQQFWGNSVQNNIKFIRALSIILIISIIYVMCCTFIWNKLPP